ncbi:hypothetical protein SacmaDRAFT_1894 [Saccharomonospora marina XMU15]|uniref:Uncharacterized protein n=1 Tax=Saccharomonospora marina XMU15 TaxID=882083 RepID=H5X7D7_9PSEU|nr:hypothetical protein [Saccharomonospora marina]EHR50156.1 hypothetical protein SacmaDRAFT_1894 [Saccharomonospora marina XMU15]
MAVHHGLWVRAHGFKGDLTNIADPSSGQNVGVCHRLFQVEENSRMAIGPGRPNAEAAR